MGTSFVLGGRIVLYGRIFGSTKNCFSVFFGTQRHPWLYNQTNGTSDQTCVLFRFRVEYICTYVPVSRETIFRSGAGNNSQYIQCNNIYNILAINQ